MRGKIFENANVVSSTGEPQSRIAGVTTETQTYSLGDTLGNLEFSIDSSSWLRVREDASPKAKLLGFTRRVEGIQSGTEIIGDYYTNDTNTEQPLLDSNGNKVSKWIKTKVPLWEKKTCDSAENAACENGSYIPVLNDQEAQEQTEGYIAELSMEIQSEDNSGAVLAITTENTTGSLPVVNIASESATAIEQQRRVLEISPEAQRVAVVNRSTLQVLNLNEVDAIGKKVMLTFVIVGELIADQKEKSNQLRESTPLSV